MIHGDHYTIMAIMVDCNLFQQFKLLFVLKCLPEALNVCPHPLAMLTADLSDDGFEDVHFCCSGREPFQAHSAGVFAGLNGCRGWELGLLAASRLFGYTVEILDGDSGSGNRLEEEDGSGVIMKYFEVMVLSNSSNKLQINLAIIIISNAFGTPTTPLLHVLMP
ncbi:hypothetical protein T265_14695, partial [Opisthorchis viverrini]